MIVRDLELVSTIVGCLLHFMRSHPAVAIAGGRWIAHHDIEDEASSSMVWKCDDIVSHRLGLGLG